MIPFTDDDLKRLKELLAKTVQPTVEDGQEYNRLMDKTGALIARLEAAETVIQQSFGHDGMALIGLDDWHEALNEWRKVAGKL